MYFANRLQAGRMLASRLNEKYLHENCAVIALSEGGVIVGAQIARQLHCVITMLVSEEIFLPREPKPIAGITADGNFVFNSEYSSAEIEDILSESRGAIEEQKMTKMHELNRLASESVLINKNLLTGRNIILVSDGFKEPFSLDLALDYLKPLSIGKLIIATPLASIKVVDWMHLNADEICCLSVLEDYSNTDHYYDVNDVPDRETVIKTVGKIISNWR